MIKRHERGESTRQISQHVGCGKTQVQNVIHNKAAVLEEWDGGDDGKKSRHSLYSELNNKIWEWFCTARSQNILITGKLIKQQAILIASTLGHDDFNASNGWLDAFKHRNNINGTG